MKNNNNNIHAANINAEAAAAEKAAEAAANMEAIDRVIDRETNASVEVNGIFETVKLVQEGKRINVKLTVLTRQPQKGEDLSDISTIDMPIGCASSEEDAKNMIADLRPYAPNGVLVTRDDVITAIGRRMHADKVAFDIVEAGENPERKIVVDGQEFFVTNGTEIRIAENSKLVTTIKSLPRLADEDLEELVFPAIREALAKMNPTPVHEEEEKTYGHFILKMDIDDDNTLEIGLFHSLDEAIAAGYEHECDDDYTGFFVLDAETGEVVEDIAF